MADLTMNGAAVLRAELTLHRTGPWRALVVVDAQEVPSGAVTLAAAGGAAFRGYVARGAADGLEQLELEVWGGAGGLATGLAAQYYRGVPLRLPLGDALREAGEVLSPTAQAAVLDVLLPKWVRPAGPASGALDALARAAPAGTTWRVLPDGAVWLGVETWAEVELEHDLLEESPARDTVTIATEQMPAALVPGVTFRGRRVSLVQHRLAADALRTTVWFERAADAGDVLRDAFRRAVRAATAETALHRLVPARVVAQDAADLSLSLRPDDPALPDLVGVPLLAFAQGAVVRLAFPIEGPAPRVLVGFAAGDPTRPMALLFEPGGALDVLELPAATRIELAGGSDFVALAAAVNDRLTKLQAAFDAHVHGVAGAATTVPTPAPGSIPVGALASVAAAKVKAT